MSACFVCGGVASHVEASCRRRVTVTANGRRFEQVDESRRFYCPVHTGEAAVELGDGRVCGCGTLTELAPVGAVSDG